MYGGLLLSFLKVQHKVQTRRTGRDANGSVRLTHILLGKFPWFWDQKEETALMFCVGSYLETS